MFVVPKSFFMYFSGRPSVNVEAFVKELLTRSSLLNFFRRNPKN